MQPVTLPLRPTAAIQARARHLRRKRINFPAPRRPRRDVCFAVPADKAYAPYARVVSLECAHEYARARAVHLDQRVRESDDEPFAVECDARYRAAVRCDDR